MAPRVLAIVALALASYTVHGFAPASFVGRHMQQHSRLHAEIPMDVVIPEGTSVPCPVPDVQIIHTGGNKGGTCDFWMRTTIPGPVTQK